MINLFTSYDFFLLSRFLTWNCQKNIITHSYIPMKVYRFFYEFILDLFYELIDKKKIKFWLFGILKDAKLIKISELIRNI